MVRCRFCAVSIAIAALIFVLPLRALAAPDAPGCSKAMNSRYLKAVAKLVTLREAVALASYYADTERHLASDRLGALEQGRYLSLQDLFDYPDDAKSAATSSINKLYDNAVAAATRTNTKNAAKFAAALQRASANYDAARESLKDYSACGEVSFP